MFSGEHRRSENLLDCCSSVDLFYSGEASSWVLWKSIAVVNALWRNCVDSVNALVIEEYGLHGVQWHHRIFIAIVC
jgi:hypothetical protein